MRKSFLIAVFALACAAFFATDASAQYRTSRYSGYYGPSTQPYVFVPPARYYGSYTTRYVSVPRATYYGPRTTPYVFVGPGSYYYPPANYYYSPYRYVPPRIVFQPNY